MRGKLTTLRRIMGIYGVIEELRSAELLSAATAVYEVQQAIGGQEDAVRSARAEGRRTLGEDDRIGWTASEAQHLAAGVKRGRLEPIRQQRQAMKETAREQYLASRLKREQMERLIVRAEEQIGVEEERRAQAESDDRFLARRWNGGAARMKTP